MIQGHRHKRLFISKNKVDFFPLVLLKDNMHIFDLGQGQPTFLTQWEGGLELVHGGVASRSFLSSSFVWYCLLPPWQTADISYYCTFLSGATSWRQRLFSWLLTVFQKQAGFAGHHGLLISHRPPL